MSTIVQRETSSIYPLVPADPLLEMVQATYPLLNSTKGRLLAVSGPQAPFYMGLDLLITQSSLTFKTVSVTNSTDCPCEAPLTLERHLRRGYLVPLL